MQAIQEEQHPPLPGGFGEEVAHLEPEGGDDRLGWTAGVAVEEDAAVVALGDAQAIGAVVVTGAVGGVAVAARADVAQLAE